MHRAGDFDATLLRTVILAERSGPNVCASESRRRSQVAGHSAVTQEARQLDLERR
jgi:hypothetical protein